MYVFYFKYSLCYRIMSYELRRKHFLYPNINIDSWYLFFSFKYQFIFSNVDKYRLSEILKFMLPIFKLIKLFKSY
jgi:hypothetical protein